jgi:hypothetical protein
MTTTQNSYNLLIASFLEPEHVEKIRQVSPERLNVIYEPALLAPPRYAADHYAVRERMPEEEKRCATCSIRSCIIRNTYLNAPDTQI